MSAGLSRKRRSRAALALLAASAACSPDIPVHPFRVQLTSGGAEFVPGGALVGTARLEGPGFLVVAPAGAPEVEIRFDTATGAAFPPDLQGEVTVAFDYDPAATDPGGAPLPVRVVRIAETTGRVRFILFESTTPEPGGLPGIPGLALPRFVGDDVPVLDTVSSHAEFEPSTCGDRYYDVLRVKAPDLTPLFLLERGEWRTGNTSEGQPPWTVLHVLSWHRSGHLCTRKAHSWIQVAEWR